MFESVIILMAPTTTKENL